MSATITSLWPRVRAQVLVADPNPVERLRVCDSLRARGCKVYEASSGPEAQSVLAGMPVHVVILDLTIGAAAGLEIVRVAARLTPRPKLLVVSEPGIGPPDSEAMIDVVVAKPCSEAQLFAIIRESLDPAGQSGS